MCTGIPPPPWPPARRNIKWYLKSMCPDEFPLKGGQWKSVLKKTKKAVDEARRRLPCKPGQRPEVRKKTAWFGIPSLPSRPELHLTSPLVLAVRLGRAECVAALCRLSTSLNTPDGFNVTPTMYAMFQLFK